MDKLALLRTFVITARAGNLAGASKKLHLTAPAISKHIRALEEYYKKSLFYRERQGLKLTDIGEQFLVQAERILGEFEQQETTLFGDMAKHEVTLKVVASHIFMKRFIEPKLIDFIEANPLLRLDLEISERIPLMEKEGIDIIGGMSVVTEENVLMRKIGETRYVCCASPAYLKKYGKPNRLADAKEHRWLTHSIRKRPNMVHFLGQEIEFDNYILTNDSLYLRQLLLAGIGMGSILEYMVDEDLQKGSLVELFVDETVPAVPICCFTRRVHHKLSKVQAFMDFFLN